MRDTELPQTSIHHTLVEKLVIILTVCAAVQTFCFLANRSRVLILSCLEHFSSTRLNSAAPLSPELEEGAFSSVLIFVSDGFRSRFSSVRRRRDVDIHCVHMQSVLPDHLQRRKERGGMRRRLFRDILQTSLAHHTPVRCHRASGIWTDTREGSYCFAMPFQNIYGKTWVGNCYPKSKTR